MRMNFGPINQSGGERRLNVAFSRAKRHMALVSSIQSADITNDYNDGANCLKNYLAYAEAVSIGDADTARRILRSLSAGRNGAEGKAETAPEILAQQLTKVLVDRGYVVDQAIGQSHFRCDLGVRRKDEAEYRLGILIDGAEYFRQSDLLERDIMRPRLLRTFGWKIAHVLAKDWYADSSAVIEQLEHLIKGTGS